MANYPSKWCLTVHRWFGWHERTDHFLICFSCLRSWPIETVTRTDASASDAKEPKAMSTVQGREPGQRPKISFHIPGPPARPFRAILPFGTVPVTLIRVIGHYLYVREVRNHRYHTITLKHVHPDDHSWVKQECARRANEKVDFLTSACQGMQP